MCQVGQSTYPPLSVLSLLMQFPQHYGVLHHIGMSTLSYMWQAMGIWLSLSDFSIQQDRNLCTGENPPSHVGIFLNDQLIIWASPDHRKSPIIPLPDRLRVYCKQTN